MKLRNKKTGEINKSVVVSTFDGFREHYYNSLAELNAEWEDYKPAEPLIGDDDERELVMNWASTYVITRVFARRRRGNATIDLVDYDDETRILVIDSYTQIQDGGTYTIDELCGEDEE